MAKFFINGGNRLEGRVRIDSAKNSLLPLLCACNLIDGQVCLKNVTKYSDVLASIEILKYLGAKVQWKGDDLLVDCSNPTRCDIPFELAGKLRSSFFNAGPILARQKKVKIAYPGGCDIGLRPIDLHLQGLRALGAKVVEKNGYIYCDGSGLRGNDIILGFPSVGATENLIMAAVLTKGVTRIYNCAKEPEVKDLANFLVQAGAKIKNIGCDVVEIEGVKKLSGITYCPISDRIVAGTYMIGVAMCGGEVELDGVQLEGVKLLISKLSNSPCNFDIKGDKIKMKASGTAKSFGRLETAAFPGFPTDLQAQMTALACISEGSSVIVENLFEARFKHIPQLIKMGGDVQYKDRVIMVNGRSKLYGADVEAQDLRGGAALVLAALAAEGYTTISGVEYIDRGYYNLENCISSLGGDIKRIAD